MEQIAAPAAGSRFLDISPHFGGAFAEAAAPSGAIFGCTLGFAIRAGDTTYMASAGHCGPVGTIWSTAAAPGFGTTALRPGYGDPERYDIGLIRSLTIAGPAPTFSDDLWQDPDPVIGNPDPTQPQLSRDGAGSRAINVGTAVCTGGARSLAQCGWITQQIGTSYCDETSPPFEQCFQHMAKADSITNRVIPGDSGGPVYGRISVTQADVRGLISGRRLVDELGLPPVHSVFFHPAQDVEARVGGVITTCC